MLESNINAGSQPVNADRSKMAYGISVTDACIGWEETEALLLEAHARLDELSPEIESGMKRT